MYTMDIQIDPAADENLLYRGTGTASASHIQLRPDESSSTTSTTGEPNVDVVESVKSLQHQMDTVTNTLQSLDKALQLLTNKHTTQWDEVSEIPPKWPGPILIMTLAVCLVEKKGGTAGSTVDEQELEEESSDIDNFLSSNESAVGPNNKLGPE